MMAPRTTTPATIRTLLSSLSELPGCVSPGWSWVPVTRQDYWLPLTTTQSFSDGGLRSPAVGAYAWTTLGVDTAPRVVRRRGPRSAPGSGRGRPAAAGPRPRPRASRAGCCGRSASRGRRRTSRGPRARRGAPGRSRRPRGRRAAPRPRRSRRPGRRGRSRRPRARARSARRRPPGSRWGCGWSTAHVASKAANRTPSASGIPSASAAATISRCASAHAAFTNFGTNVTMQTPPPAAIRSSTSSGTLRGLSVTARAELWLKITGASATSSAAAHRVGGDVGQVDHHPDPVHLPDHLAAELRQPAGHRSVGGRVGPRGVRVVGQRHVAHAELVQLAQRAERAVDRVAALRTHQRGHPARTPRPARPRRRWSPTPAGRRTSSVRWRAASTCSSVALTASSPVSRVGT